MGVSQLSLDMHEREREGGGEMEPMAGSNSMPKELLQNIQAIEDSPSQRQQNKGQESVREKHTKREGDAHLNSIDTNTYVKQLHGNSDEKLKGGPSEVVAESKYGEVGDYRHPLLLEEDG